MNQPKNNDRYCIIRQSSGCTDSGNECQEPMECDVLTSLQKHLKCDKSSRQANMLSETMLHSICECAGLNCMTDEECSTDSDNTVKVVNDRINELDLEIQMLNLRKSALVRRIKSLEKLAWRLDEKKNID